MSWANEPLTGVALATTGIEPGTARIVAVGHRTVNDGNNQPATVTVVRTPVTIPPAAAQVHGITDDIAATGKSPHDAVSQVVADLNEAATAQRGLVVFNATWFFATLGHEARTLGIEFAIPQGLCVIDPLILDQRLTTRRRAGGRTLRSLTQAWGVEQPTYGPADANADAALRLAWKIGRTHPYVRDLTLSEIHDRQREWHHEIEDERDVYLASRGRLIPA